MNQFFSAICLMIIILILIKILRICGIEKQKEYGLKCSVLVIISSFYYSMHRVNSLLLLFIQYLFSDQKTSFFLQTVIMRHILYSIPIQLITISIVMTVEPKNLSVCVLLPLYIILFTLTNIFILKTL